MILFGNIDTTFVGAQDDLRYIFKNHREVGILITYIHIDGALGLGYKTCGIKLWNPGMGANDTPLVQETTSSHHKALKQSIWGRLSAMGQNFRFCGRVLTLNPESYSKYGFTTELTSSLTWLFVG